MDNQQLPPPPRSLGPLHGQAATGVCSLFRPVLRGGMLAYVCVRCEGQCLDWRPSVDLPCGFINGDDGPRSIVSRGLETLL